MNGVSRHLRASSLPSLIRSYGGIKSVCRFSSQSDGSSGSSFPPILISCRFCFVHFLSNATNDDWI